MTVRVMDGLSSCRAFNINGLGRLFLMDRHYCNEKNEQFLYATTLLRKKRYISDPDAGCQVPRQLSSSTTRVNLSNVLVNRREFSEGNN